MEHQFTYDQLNKKTLAQLRELAGQLNHPEVQGYTQLHKSELLPKVCKVLGVEAHHHHEVVGIDKTKVKQQIRKLKTERSQALSERDSGRLKEVRQEIHSLKRKLRRAMI